MAVRIGVDGVVGITEGRPTMSNTIVWTDIPVVDLERAIEFYSAVFDTKLSKEDFGGVSLSVLPHAGEGGVGGCKSGNLKDGDSQIPTATTAATACSYTEEKQQPPGPNV